MQCVVLAGGQSRRMGRNKALLPIKGEPMIQRVIETCQKLSNNIVVVSNDPNTYPFIKQKIISDRYPNKGPLAGLESAMYHSDDEWFILAPCDSPSLSHEVFKHLLTESSGSDIVVPVFNGKEQPLHGLYHRTCYETIKSQLEQNSLRMRDLFEKHNTKFIHQFNPSITNRIVENHFTNLNHPEEYENWVNE